MQFSKMMLPWETYAEQAARERREEETGERWTDELLAECREHALEYSSKLTSDFADNIVPMHQLLELKRVLPFHMRGEVFEGVRLDWDDRR